ncbi:MAG: hypothetical protein OXB93_06600 [Cytophagales bacterium]|nr:hypothetical protein [Cytophagales bacterium]
MKSYRSHCYLLGLSLFFSSPFLALAQKGWNWPEDKATAQERKVLYTDLMNHGNFEEAAQNIQWLLDNAPDLHVSLYIHAQKIFTALAKQASEPQKKREYQDKVMSLFDERIKYFQGEANVSNRKALAAYNFFRKEQSMYPELIQILEKAVHLNQEKVIDYNLLALMDIVQREKKLSKTLTEDDVLRYYALVSDILEIKKANVKDSGKERLEKISRKIDKILTTTVNIDCVFIRNKLFPRFEKNPTDLKQARNIFRFLVIAKCDNENDIFLSTGQAIYQGEPTYRMGKVLAQKSAALKRPKDAIFYFEDALKHVSGAEASRQKAEANLAIARLYAGMGDKIQSRNYARTASEFGANKADVFNLIGNLYLSSYEDCRKGVSRVEDKAVYIAAYNAFQKAGNQKMMSLCMEQFPTKSEIFELGLSEGSDLNLDCWINEIVNLQRKKE